MIIDKNDVAVNSILQSTDSGDLKLLEVGCGDGRITSGLKGKFKKLVAIDPDLQSIKHARQKYPQIDFSVGNGESLQFEDDSFDIVLFSLSLHHQNGIKALKEAERVLAPEGKVLILEPSIESPISQLCSIFDDETIALRQAIENIKTCGLTTTSIRKIVTNWVFQDKNELYTWLSDYYNQQPDSNTLHQIDIFLGKMLKESPITIGDTLLLTQLAQIPDCF